MSLNTSTCRTILATREVGVQGNLADLIEHRLPQSMACTNATFSKSVSTVTQSS
jgi:hypothetical protein